MQKAIILGADVRLVPAFSVSFVSTYFLSNTKLIEKEFLQIQKNRRFLMLFWFLRSLTL